MPLVSRSCWRMAKTRIEEPVRTRDQRRTGAAGHLVRKWAAQREMRFRVPWWSKRSRGIEARRAGGLVERGILLVRCGRYFRGHTC